MSAPNIIYPPSSGGGGGTITGSGGSQYVAVWSGTSTLTTGSLTDTGSRVGISQTSPVTTFQVGGNTVATASPVGAFCTLGSNSRFTADDGTRAVTLAANGTNAIVGTTTAHDLLVQTNGATKLFVQDSTGRIGVGNTDPATLIETYGTAGIRASSDTVANIGVFQYSADTSPATLTLRKARGTRAAQTTVATADGLGSVNFTAYGGTSGSVLSSISANVVTYTSNANISSNLTFGTSASGSATPTTRLTIDEAGVSTFTGPVRATGTAASAPAFTGSDTDTGIYFPAANQVRLSTNATPALSIDASQNVGIANTTGTILGKLHVGSGATAPVVTTPGLIVTGPTSEARLVVKESTVGAEWFVLPSTTQVSMGNVNAYNLEIKTTNAARLIVGSTGIVTVGATAGATTNTLDVSTAGWGVKLPTTTGNGNANTLDCYAEGSYTPSLTGANQFLGTIPTITVNYTRIGRLVTLTAKIAPTGATTWGATQGGTVFPYPSGITPASDSQIGTGVVANSSNGQNFPGAWCHPSNGVYLPNITNQSQTCVLSVQYFTAT